MFGYFWVTLESVIKLWSKKVAFGGFALQSNVNTDEICPDQYVRVKEGDDCAIRINGMHNKVARGMQSGPARPWLPVETLSDSLT